MASSYSPVCSGLSRISTAELETALYAHSAFVAHVNGGRRGRFVSRDLANVDLSNRVLSGADFTGADLSGANLRLAEFVETTLYCCDMRRVDGRYANFSHADMRGAMLSGSLMTHAKLNYADFREGRLMRMANDDQQLIARSGTADNVNFGYSSLCGANFENARLEGANFSGAILHASHFKGAKLANAVFEGAVLEEVDLDEMDLPSDILKSCILAPTATAKSERSQQIARLDQHQRWIATDGRDGRAAVFDGEDLRPLADDLSRYKLTAISAKGVIAVALDFARLELQGANFEDADLRGANFEGADLRGVRLKNARLGHAKFTGADLRPLQMASGDVMVCDFSGAELAVEQLEAAIRA